MAHLVCGAPLLVLSWPHTLPRLSSCAPGESAPLLVLTSNGAPHPRCATTNIFFKTSNGAPHTRCAISNPGYQWRFPRRCAIGNLRAARYFGQPPTTLTFPTSFSPPPPPSLSRLPPPPHLICTIDSPKLSG